ncbi:hypothetical protein GNF10_36335 [Nostoc sp. UCD121]|uniref:hypothetical protein n=1 Tax=unclassified Nostoc TaxID=2593658 RepID=UPI001628E04B|nr:MULTISPECIES: hypothetical protein [unclassified Nostoc]MBC1218555.1 hypothetical protein [Nostoc sp. UCD120]MBC1281245.1 hypothetical protein [Nostoc sp. UCD121]MBC1299979.1 hypothetical protein [Nostoc sp. UCD122]
MKIPNLINSTHFVAWINSIPKITSVHKANNKKSGASMNTAVNSDVLSSYSKNVNSLKSFDTALIAYQMMGLSNFDERR